jgi:FlaA1/EpsC-like NDP-sugar epimerase
MKVAILRYRRPISVIAHLTMALVSNVVAFGLRFDFRLPSAHRWPLLYTLPWLLAIRGVSFWVFGLYYGLWRYASLSDLQRIIGAVGLSSLTLIVFVRSPWGVLPYPRSVLLIDSAVLILFLGGIRLARRAYHEFNRIENERRVLVYGAGDAGELIVRDMRNNRFYNADPIGFIDDDQNKRGLTIHGVRVLGTRDDLPRIIESYRPSEVLIAIPTALPAQVRAIVRSLERFKVPIKTLPNLSDVLDGKVEISAFRNLSPEDLMAREPIRLDPEPVRHLINGRRVLVTGAGGSIGSELVRQLAAFGPARLVLVERNENALFEICNDLEVHHSGCNYEPVVADITDAARLESLFGAARPDIVFHAAAHKHVPLMEANPSEAIKNNVRGTRLLAEAASRWDVGDFVLISTDKAVNPSSVMGASKRVGELLMRSFSATGRTRFVAVRFGNVLNSSGSVTTVFAQQIKRGGPLTVTHPEIRRFFMLIPEAVQLVLHAAAMRDEAHVYILDMGEQIRIVDLARNLIRLSGFVPEKDIAIQFVGLRPGEKLFEELSEESEIVEPSEVQNVMRLRTQVALPANLADRIAQLELAGAANRDADVVDLLADLVPTFRTARTSAAQPAVATVGNFPGYVHGANRSIP